MAATVMSLEDFANSFEVLCRHRDRDAHTRPFALILGAGASRSAGIPLASEMIEALEMLAKASGIRVSGAATDALSSAKKATRSGSTRRPASERAACVRTAIATAPRVSRSSA